MTKKEFETLEIIAYLHRTLGEALSALMIRDKQKWIVEDLRFDLQQQLEKLDEILEKKR